MARNDTIDLGAGIDGTAIPDLIGDNDMFVDLLEVKSLLDVPDDATDAGAKGLVQDARSVFLIDDIDLGDVIADSEAPRETDLTVLFDQPIEDFTTRLTAIERSGEEGFALTSLDGVPGGDFWSSDSAILQASASDQPAGGFIPTPVTIIVDDGSDSFGTPV